MNKPLTKEEREGFARMGGAGLDGLIPISPRLLDALLSAEAYWREAVKKLPEHVDESDGQGPAECLICGSPDFVMSALHKYEKFPHKPDCPWVLAQD